ncbi:glycopeptide antibiotics resistance protein [Paenibacillus taihuensis]|uniref:Glycopeptide antibiotics resistance protein n=1 Tax=Paenibacillus taihuensis TaxID=1156355 RepID=A0A3D9QUS2_9BACL|nr:VanZ family protein [Paenibacillus taihuensis]REE67596.1 glycopeptide antibiotics resistance protein [Paenibacillus taihuensis]
MLTFYLFPISYAFLSFPIAALLFTLPFLLVQYRRHGYVNKYRAMLLYLFLLYFMNAFYLILLPFPSSVHNEPPTTGSYVQWIPFHFVLDIMKETGVDWGHPSTYLRLVQERAVLQVVFNVLLTVPFGMFLRYYFRTGWLKCLLLTLGLSLFFEVTQVTGIYGIFDYPYRLMDIDDVMTNTVGGMLGFVAAEWLSLRLPRIDKLDANIDLASKRVSYTRRMLAFMLDWFVLNPVIAVLAILKVPVPYIIAVVSYFIVIPYLSNGQTFGKWFVRIRVRGAASRLGIRELLIRYGLLYGIVGGVNALMISIGAHRGGSSIAILPLLLIVFAVNAIFGIHLIMCLFNRKRQLFYERRSGTDHAITLKSVKTGRNNAS